MEVWQGLANLARLLLVVIATGGVCCQLGGWSERIERRGTFFESKRGSLNG